jgi:hypothetical protein
MDRVNVVGRQAIGPDLDARFPRPLSQKITIDLLIAVLKEDRLSPVSPLGDVMRQAGDHDASETCHAPEHIMNNRSGKWES